MIRVLIVDDSPVAQEFLVHILTSDPLIRVVGIVANGALALTAVRDLRPDVITMDIHMPHVDGFEATRAIMESLPTPIVIVSASTSATELASTFKALEAGALAVMLRPPGPGHPQYETCASDLIQTVKLMSEIKLVRRIPRPVSGRPPAPLPAAAAPKAATVIRMAAIGASTGGPPVLQKILSGLPRDLSAPLLIVQHITPGFVEGFVDWLGSASGFPVHVAAHGELPLPAHAYVAPDGWHMGVDRGRRIVLSDDAPENGLRPSVAHLFRSSAQVLGAHALGVLLTGMGRDGAAELKMMRDGGAITIAQDAASSVVHGMPGEAIKLEAATYVLPPEGIAAMLAALLGRTNKERA